MPVEQSDCLREGAARGDTVGGAGRAPHGGMRIDDKRLAVATVWDLYLDADDAVVLLDAVATLERHRAVREPMPLADASLLLRRFQTIAGVAEQDAVYWRREADDRREEADADGGRWGEPRIASIMVTTADDLADGARVIASAAYGAASDLAQRLGAGTPGHGAGGTVPGLRVVEDLTDDTSDTNDTNDTN